MRNLVLVLVALLAVPAFAAPALDLVDLGGGNVALDFTTSGSLVSGMGLKITATNGAVLSTHADGAQGTKYWVHPSNILIDGLGNLTSKGSAVASNDANGLKLEYGALYVRSNPSDPNKPGASGRLCTFKVDKSCTVTVVSDYAGGVVTEDFNSFTTLTDSVVITIATYPACWNYLTQCNGDSNGDGAVNSTDFLALKSSYNKVKGDTLYNPCADSNRDGAVNSTDFLALKNNYNKTPAATCVQGDINHIY